MSTIKEKQNKVFETFKEEFGYKNTMQAPRLEKVVLSVGMGSSSGDKNKVEIIQDRLAKITGQKAAVRKAKKSVAGFKVREGENVGYQVTLRGERMFGFLDKLIDVAFPRTKDFRGLSLGSIDEMGNATLGIKEHIIFPETSDEEIRNVFGMAVTIVTTAKNKKEAVAFLRHLGFPFKKVEEVKKKKKVLKK
ncbi:MAG: 50S ribosomal protein L5 [Patescibacteria group bacterium]